MAALLALGVIPQLLVDPFPGATIGPAAVAFAVVAIINVVVGLAGYDLSHPPLPWDTRRRGLRSVVAGLVLLVVAFALLDAATAFVGEGPAMRGAAVHTSVCVALDVVGGISLLLSPVISRRSQRA